VSGWRTLAEEWMARADEDIGLLGVGLTDPRITHRNFGYHAQQAIEKLLKAMIADKGVEPRRTHDLRDLADTVAELHALDTDPLNGPDLTAYATAHRYPGFAPPPELDRESVHQQVLAIRDIARRLRRSRALAPQPGQAARGESGPRA
jgi:HEPN domain-containing protein